MKKIIMFAVAAGLTLSSCGMYRKYQAAETVPDKLYGEQAPVPVDTAGNMAGKNWNELFTDPQLQALIDEGLRNNTDLQSAYWQVKAAEASLKAAKLAYLPSFNLTPNGNVGSFDGSKATWTYTAPVAASWELDILGRITNSKRQSEAALMQSQEYKQAVQTQLVSAIANSYYSLLMLDEQYRISQEMAQTLKESVRTMKAMMNAGMTNSAGVSQTEASYFSLESSLRDMERSIEEVENSLSALLGSTPRKIARGKLSEQNFSTELNIGVPVQLLANRPDVRAAEQSLAQAYYATNIARASLYPSLTLSGSAGWTNNSGAGIVNPGKLILSAVGSLTQPIFNGGRLRANVKVAEAQQEQAKLAFQQSLLDAGKEVNDALAQYQKAQEKVQWREQEIASSEKAVKQTELLMAHSSTTYLEVLTAKQSLLQSRLSQTTDRFESIQGVINLYHALGGGRDMSAE